MINLRDMIMVAPFGLVRSAWIARARLARAQRDRGASMMESNGFVRIAHDSAAEFTADGRKIIRAYGDTWVLPPEVHKQRVEAALMDERRREVAQSEPVTKSVSGTETMSTMVCTKCGDALQYTTVCPKCAAGKLGYRHRYTCVCGGVDLISKDKL